MGRGAQLLVLGAGLRSGATVIELPPQAIELAKRFEGFHRVPKHDPGRAHPYRCPAGYWTVGFGRLCASDHPPIDLATAERYLLEDLRVAMTATLRLCPVLAAEPPDRLAAIVDFTFNLGAGRLQASRVRGAVQSRNWPAVAQQLGRWVYSGGVVLPGLVVRRKAEISFLFLSDMRAVN